ncbi:hypothetical protein CAPTEDRAFT_19905 [Capitella teleta]|uniref:Ferritin n=1 Tax=Capitella teleta TaxID=283909 RepID=R7TVB6_CAPTE|nr:hypothetical protein CAPTEDRAFT_19905 [Capitella teleta]|eukprot:ELT95406.1 hypothetical protein CAPTEDRAFT_19905 [Capitella teleta]
MAATSLCRQNFHSDCEALINKQINMEMHANYVYTSMAYYFDRDDVALSGFARFFRKAAEEEREHAERLMKYQNTRGGRVVLQDIQKPEQEEWGTGLDAMLFSLDMEKRVNQSLLDLESTALAHADPELADFIASEYLHEQVAAIKGICCHITNLRRCGCGLGEFLYQKEALGP